MSGSGVFVAVIIIVFLLIIIISIMNSSNTGFWKKLGIVKFFKGRDSFNPGRNFRKPKDSVFKDHLPDGNSFYWVGEFEHPSPPLFSDSYYRNNFTQY